MSTPHLDPPHFQRLIALELVPSVLDGAVLECIVLGHGRGQDPDSVPSRVMELELPIGLFDPRRLEIGACQRLAQTSSTRNLLDYWESSKTDS